MLINTASISPRIIGTFGIVACCYGFVGCSEHDARSSTIEYDEYDPLFHGTEVRFNVPMVYFTLDENDPKDFTAFTPTQLKVGKVLIGGDVDTIKNYNHGKDRTIVPVRDNQPFTIKSSFWVRQDWHRGMFAPDIDSLIIVDVNGSEYVTLRLWLRYSDRPEYHSGDLEHDQ